MFGCSLLLCYKFVIIITTLLKLQQNGVKDDDIIGLSKIIDIGRMAKEWRPSSPRPIPKTDVGMGMNQGLNYNMFNWNYGFPIGLEQGKSSNPGNGGSSNPDGYSGGKTNGFNFSSNDLRKFNLLE